MRIYLLIFLVVNLQYNSLAYSKIDSLKKVAFSTENEFESRIASYGELTQIFCGRSLDSGLYFINEGINLAEKAEDQLTLMDLHMIKAKLYISFYDFDNSTKECELSLKNARLSANDSVICTSLIYTASAYGSLGDWDKSILLNEEAIPLAIKIKNFYLAGNAYNNCGNAYCDKHEFSKAFYCFSKGLEQADSAENLRMEGYLHCNIGRVHYYLGNHKKAIEEVFHGLEIGEQLNDEPLLILAFNNLVSNYIALEKFEMAIKIKRKLIVLQLKNRDKINVTWSYNSMAAAFSELEQYDSALYYQHKAITLKKELGDSTHLGIIQNNLAQIYYAMNDFQNAEKELMKTLDLLIIKPDSEAESYANYLLGNIYVDDQPEKAVEFYQKSIAIAEEYELNHYTVKNSLELYKHYKNVGNWESSLKYYEKYTVSNEATFGEQNKLALQEMELKFGVKLKDSEIAVLQKSSEIKAIQLANAEERSKVNLQITVLIFAIILLIGIIIMVRYRQSQSNKMNAIEKRNLKIETDKLRSQINPHFIFNSLNSIQSFISGNKTIDAERYLAKFARLMRLILENSRRSFIDFESELETLKLYLELEQLRFNQNFKYEINIKGIDEEYTQVPPMLAQPYIENAILHGVRTIDNGLITINYNKIGEKISCIIDDNGIGRDRAAQLKSLHAAENNSLGIKVTQERIDLLSEEYNLDLSVQVIDKKGQENQSLGTKIVLEMPWNE